MVRAGTGKTLDGERFEADVTGVAVAKHLGIHRSTLSAYYHGWRIPPEGWAAFTQKHRTAVKQAARDKAATDARDERRRREGAA